MKSAPFHCLYRRRITVNFKASIFVSNSAERRIAIQQIFKELFIIFTIFVLLNQLLNYSTILILYIKQ